MSESRVGFVADGAGRRIAYRIVGSGDRDVLWMPNFFTHIDIWEIFTPFRQFLEPLAALGRVFHFDQPGTGASDVLPPDKLPTIERWGDATLTVFDHLGVERAIVIAEDSAGPPAIVFAASHPERVERLILINSFARMMSAPGYPFGLPEHLRQAALERWVEIWGTGKQTELLLPGTGEDNERLAGMVERIALRPNQFAAVVPMMLDVDVRDIVPHVRVPTTVIHRTANPWIRIEHGRWLAEHIPGATLVEVSGAVHYSSFPPIDEIIDAITTAVTGVAPAMLDAERALATVLFTDIAGSTSLAAAVGDKAWRGSLDRLDAAVSETVSAFRGRVVKFTGDGHVITFDGPGRAVRCAMELRAAADALGMHLRTGLHCGEVELRGDDIGGLAVHAAARVMGLAEAGEVLVSQTVKDLTIGSGIRYDERGTRELRGVPGEWKIFEALG